MFSNLHVHILTIFQICLKEKFVSFCKGLIFKLIRPHLLSPIKEST